MEKQFAQQQQTAINKPGMFIQPKLTINQPNDAYEQEADAMADKVMRMEQPGVQLKPLPITGIQRKCTHCEEEEKVQRKENNTNETTANNNLENYVGSLNSSGQPLPNEVRSFYEPRFGYDFSNVKVHTDDIAAKSAQSINALAYTSGNNVVFNNAQYSPNTDSGKRLLGHELTHVVQQGSGGVSRKNIQKAIGSRTRCTANAHSSPADPLSVIQQANERAVHMALGASHLLFSDSLFMQSATFGSSGILNMYRRRFGDPIAHRTKFKNRFNNSLHNTLLLAQASEMQYLSTRSENISDFLNGNIHFKCTGTSRTTIGDCTHRCGANTILASCSSGHKSEMAICSGFWGMSSDQQAIGMIHEVSHMLYHYRDRDRSPYAQTASQRRREPECYTSLIADIYSVVPFDPSCPLMAL